MIADPDRGWTGKELAEHIQVPPRNMLTQLAEWTRLGFLARAGAGVYRLAETRSLTMQAEP
jgi:DNA-binding IclR family transcriptional regulator